MCFYFFLQLFLKTQCTICTFFYICAKNAQKVHENSTQKLNYFKIMEKNLLIENLKTKAGVDNLSDRTFDEVATIFLPQFAEDDKITEDSYKLPLQMLKTMSGQLRHEVAEGINKGKSQWETDQKAAQQKAIDDAMAAFKTQWEKDHPTTTPPANDPLKDEKTLEEKITEAVAAAMGGLTAEEGAIGKLTKQFTEYIQKTEQDKKDAIVNKIREDLKDYLLNVRIADKEACVNLAVKEMEIDEKSDFDRLKIDVEKRYEKLYKEFYGDTGGGPYAGGAGGATDSNKEFEKYIKERQKAAEEAAKEADELEKSMM